MKIIGIEGIAFTGKDGTQVTGSTIYVTDPIPSKRGQGESADHFFLSSAKLAALEFTPAVGQQVSVLYNKFGKVATIKLVDDFIEIE